MERVTKVCRSVPTGPINLTPDYLYIIAAREEVRGRTRRELFKVVIGFLCWPMIDGCEVLLVDLVDLVVVVVLVVELCGAWLLWFWCWWWWIWCWFWLWWWLWKLWLRIWLLVISSGGCGWCCEDNLNMKWTV